MRISVDPQDPGYSADAVEAKVILEGVELHDCVTADDVEGLCVCLARDENGKFVTEGDRLTTVERRGEVKIVLPA